MEKNPRRNRRPNRQTQAGADLLPVELSQACNAWHLSYIGPLFRFELLPVSPGCHASC